MRREKRKRPENPGESDGCEQPLRISTQTMVRAKLLELAASMRDDEETEVENCGEIITPAAAEISYEQAKSDKNLGKLLNYLNKSMEEVIALVHQYANATEIIDAIKRPSVAIYLRPLLFMQLRYGDNHRDIILGKISCSKASMAAFCEAENLTVQTFNTYLRRCGIDYSQHVNNGKYKETIATMTRNFKK